jgi:outer membrane cobalamin receptor
MAFLLVILQINNSFDLNNINPNQVERIEILKGAQSTLWGSDAVAGVINIITKKGADKSVSPSAMVSMEAIIHLRPMQDSAVRMGH